MSKHSRESMLQTLARYFLRPLNSRKGWTRFRYTWTELIAMVKCCPAWNYTAVAASWWAVFSVLFLRQVLLAVRFFWLYIQHDRIVRTHVQGQSVKSSPGKLLSESKRVCGREVAEKHAGFEAYRPLVHRKPSRRWIWPWRVQIQRLVVVLLPRTPHCRRILTQQNRLLWLLVLLASGLNSLTGSKEYS